MNHEEEPVTPDSSSPSSSATKKKPRHRLSWWGWIRGTCKWGGVTLCVLLFALWLASGWWVVCWETASGSGAYLYHGAIVLEMLGGAERRGFPPRWSARQEQFDLSEWKVWWLRWGPFEQFIRLEVPLWVPAAVCLAPPGFLMVRERWQRKRIGLCRTCGYDLTGNTSGKCPECGAATTVRAASS